MKTDVTGELILDPENTTPFLAWGFNDNVDWHVFADRTQANGMAALLLCQGLVVRVKVTGAHVEPLDE